MIKIITIDWNKNNNDNISLIDLIENEGLDYKKKYIKFVDSLSKYKGYENLNIDKQFNLWWMSILHEKNFYKSYNINYVLKLFALTEFIKIAKFEKIIIRDVPKICKKQIKELEEIFGIGITVYYEKNDFLRLRFKTFIPRIAQSFYTLTKYYLKSFKFKNNVLKISSINTNKEKNFLIVNYLLNYNKDLLEKGIYHSDYWGDLPTILKNKGYEVNWLHVFGDNNNQLNEFIKKTNLISNNNNGEKHFFLENQFNFKIYFKVIFKYFKIVFKNYNLYFGSKNLNFKYNKINLWEIYKDEWRDSFFGSLLIKNILTFELFKKNYKILPKNHKCLYLHEGQGWEKSLIYNFKSNSKIIGVIQSPIRFWDIKLYDYIINKNEIEKNNIYFPDILAVNSEFGYNMINDVKINKSIFKVEPLRSKILPAFKISKKFKDKKIKVLVLGGLYNDLTDELFRNIYEIINKNYQNKFLFKFRFHPGYVNNNILNINDLDNHLNIYEAIIDNDIIIVTGDTSSSIDAYILKKKIIVYLGHKSLNINPLRNFEEIKFSRNIEDLKNEINFFSTSNNQKKLYLKQYYYKNKNLLKWKKLLI